MAICDFTLRKQNKSAKLLMFRNYLVSLDEFSLLFTLCEQNPSLSSHRHSCTQSIHFNESFLYSLQLT